LRPSIREGDMPIKNITEVYRPQRQGKIHLGVKVVKKKGTEDVEYPKEVDYFVLKDAPGLEEIYKGEPKELHITLPTARFEAERFDQYLDKVFPQWLKRYGKAGLYCKGDGDTATCLDPETGMMKEQACPCAYLESGDCKRIGILRIRIQEIPSFNVYQITTSSFNSIVNINSFIRDLTEFCLVNRIDTSNVKLVLRRGEQDVQRLEGGQLKKSRHYIMTMDLDPRFYKTLDDVRPKALPQPVPAPKQLPPADESLDDLYYPDAKAAAAQKEAQEEEERKSEAVKKAEEPAKEKAKAPEPEGKPGDEISEMAEHGPDPKATCTVRQLEKFAKAREELTKLGIGEETMWKGIHPFVAKTYKIVVTEASEFTVGQMDGILTYLGAYKKTIEEKRATKAARTAKPEEGLFKPEKRA